MKRSTILFLGAILGLNFLLRTPSLPVKFYNVDEASSAVIANAIIDGKMPYQSAVEHRGPVTYYAYAIIFSLCGKNNMQAIHFFLNVLIALEAILIYRIGLSAFNRLK